MGLDVPHTVLNSENSPALKCEILGTITSPAGDEKAKP